jgi:hypothetical protein
VLNEASFIGGVDCVGRGGAARNLSNEAPFIGNVEDRWMRLCSVAAGSHRIMGSGGGGLVRCWQVGILALVGRLALLYSSVGEVNEFHTDTGINFFRAPLNAG